MRISFPKIDYPPRAQVGDTVYYRSPINRYAVKRSIVTEIRLGNSSGYRKYEQVMQNGDVVLKDPRSRQDVTTFPKREIAMSHIMATLIEHINGRQMCIDSLIYEQQTEQRILATMQKFNPDIKPERYNFMIDVKWDDIIFHPNDIRKKTHDKRQNLST